MLNYMRLYIALNWKRDLLVLLSLAVCMVGLYAVMHYRLGYASGLGDVRHVAAQLWTLWCGEYAVVASFSAFGRGTLCPLLLPAPRAGKFLAVFLRVAVVMPVLGAGIVEAMDWAIVSCAGVGLRVLNLASTMTECLTYTGMPLHYLPIMPYYMAVFTALGMLTSTFTRRRAVAMLCAMVVAVVAVWCGPHAVYPDLGYPFVYRMVTVDVPDVWWRSAVSWTHLPIKVSYLISYVWLAAVPAAIYVMSYLRFKEIKLQ